MIKNTQIKGSEVMAFLHLTNLMVGQALIGVWFLLEPVQAISISSELDFLDGLGLVSVLKSKKPDPARLKKQL